MGVDGGWEKSFVEDQCGCVGVGLESFCVEMGGDFGWDRGAWAVDVCFVQAGFGV